jgi:hypothetical protein
MHPGTAMQPALLQQNFSLGSLDSDIYTIPNTAEYNRLKYIIKKLN